MNIIIPLSITLITLAIVIYLINKKVNPVLLFFGFGFLLQLYQVFVMGQSPLGEETTGNNFMDIFGLMTSIFKKQMSGVGANIMLVAGFATLMNSIGASAKLADVMMKPLLKLNKPYLVVAGLFLVGVFLKLMITSHAGHGLLLMTIIYPILIKLGVSRVSAASVIILSGVLDWGPNNSVVLHAAETVSGIPVGEFFLNHQLLPGILTALAIAIVIAVYFKYADSKQGVNQAQAVEDDEKAQAHQAMVNSLPTYYAILPAVPLTLIIIFTLIPNVTLDVFSANIIGIIMALIIETVRANQDKLSLVTGHLDTVWKTMGNSFANIVVLIIAAGFFADGLLALGGVDILANSLTQFESAGVITMFVLSLLILLTVIALGSGVASWYAFGPLLVDIAPAVGLDVYQLAIPVQLASGMGRGISPVAAAGLSVAGLAEVEITDTIKRSALPLIIGWIVSVLSSYLFV